MKKEIHVHKFKRLRFKSGNIIFFCALPDCNKKMNISLALGKRSLCWRCGKEFILDEYSIRLSKPHCEECHVPKNKKEVRENEMTDEIIKEMNKASQPLSLAERLNQAMKHAVAKDEVTEEDI